MLENRNINERTDQSSDEAQSYALLLVKVPRTNDKKELSAEQMFAALHGILKAKTRGFKSVEQEHIGFEIVAIGNNIYFYIWMPKHLQNFVEGQVYAQYSSAQISTQAEDYTLRPLEQKIVHAVEIGLTD